MASNDQVVWSEGMFLRPQHFQQHTRYLERLVRDVTRPLRSFNWGVSELRLNRELMAMGQFSVEHAAGIFQEGTPFRLREDAEALLPLQVPPGTRNTMIYLTLPITSPGGREVAPPEAAACTRYTTTEIEVGDCTSSEGTTAPVTVARQRLQYALETQDRSGTLGIGLARIAEVRPNNEIILDETHIPPVMDVSVSRVFTNFLNEAIGLLDHRADAIATRLSPSSISSFAQVSDLMMLQAINRWQPVLAHLSSASLVHPECLFSVLAALAGELSTFQGGTRRPDAFPTYVHEQLYATFAPLMMSLRRSLQTVLEDSAIPIPLARNHDDILVAETPDRSIFENCAFVLCAKGEVQMDVLPRRLSGQIKIGPSKRIGELVSAALPGIRVRYLPTPPRQIPHRNDTAYFELDRTSQLWNQVQDEGDLAIHIAGDFPALELGLWACKD